MRFQFLSQFYDLFAEICFLFFEITNIFGLFLNYLSLNIFCADMYNNKSTIIECCLSCLNGQNEIVINEFWENKRKMSEFESYPTSARVSNSSPKSFEENESTRRLLYGENEESDWYNFEWASGGNWSPLWRRIRSKVKCRIWDGIKRINTNKSNVIWVHRGRDTIQE
jgi:hypothetical protein